MPRPGFARALDVVARAVILLSSVAMMVRDLGAPVHGNFYFRQAHVEANIEHFVQNGLSLVPTTYNLDVPYAIFDFPAYQLLVAWICRTFGSDPLLTARVVNVAIFVIAFILIDRLLLAAGIRRMHRVAALFLFCFSPMNLFYYRSPIVDPLAIVLSLVSLYCVIRLERTARGPRRYLRLAALLASAVLSTLIKNPVYLPVFVAVVAYALWRKFEPLKPPELLLYVAAVGSTVLGFKAWSNRVNGVRGFFDASETSEYFGPLADRLDPESWHRIERVLYHDAANLLTAALAVLGVALWAFRSRNRHKALFLALAEGWLLTVVVFFNRFTWHNYYLLGIEFPLAFFGAYSLDRLLVLRRAWRRREPRALLPVSAALAAVFGYTVVSGMTGMRELSATPTEWIRERGDFIRRSTSPNDFVLYLVESEDFQDWNPVFLYFAQRHGYNVTTRRMERHPSILARLEARYGHSGQRFLVFCPPGAAPRFAPLLEASGARLLEASSVGSLYQLPAKDGGRNDQRSSRQIETTGPGRSTLPGR